MAFNTHNKDEIEIRPRFKLLSSSSAPKEFLEKVKNALPKDSTIVGKIAGDHVFLSIPENEQHFWSPAMEVVVGKDYDDENLTAIRCLIGPKQSIWMMVMFLYVSVGAMLFFGGMYGLVNWSLDNGTKFLWFIPIGAVLELLIFLATKWGQKQGRDQMLHLVSFLYHALDDENLVRE